MCRNGWTSFCLIVLMGVSIASLGCSGASSDVDALQASQVSSAMVVASTEVQSQVTVQLKQWREIVAQNGKPTSPWVTGTLNSFQVQGSVTNPKGGGTAVVKGSGSYATTDLSVTMQVIFTDWAHGTLTITGTITTSVEVKTTGVGAGGVSTKTTVKGSLVVKGLDTKIPNIPVVLNIDLSVQTTGSNVAVCGKVANYSINAATCP